MKATNSAIIFSFFFSNNGIRSCLEIVKSEVSEIRMSQYVRIYGIKKFSH